MLRRRIVAGFLLAIGSLAGAALFRRRGSRRRERVDLYFGDGSLASLPQGSPEAARLTALARDFLRTARS